MTKKTEEIGEKENEAVEVAEASETPKAPEVSETKVPSVALPAFYGVKAGMTRIFDDSGNHVPVTVVKIVPNFITQVKTLQKDGYEAYQIAYFEKREKLVSKPVKGILAKAKVEKNLTRFSELRTGKVDTAHLGGCVSLDHFPSSTLVDVTGISQGKGFQGVIKRWNFSQGPLSHGSKFHRTGGSIGNRATPGKVWKNKKMPGHMGAVRRTVQNLRVVEVNHEKGYMLIRGAVPGAKNGLVRVCRATKGREQGAAQ